MHNTNRHWGRCRRTYWSTSVQVPSSYLILIVLLINAKFLSAKRITSRFLQGAAWSRVLRSYLRQWVPDYFWLDPPGTSFVLRINEPERTYRDWDEEYWFTAGVIRTVLLPATGPPRISVPRTWDPARTATGNFCHGNTLPLPLHTTSPRVTEVTSRAPPTLPYPPPIYSRCAERPGVRSLCLEEFLETLLSSDQGGRDFSWPTTSTAKREPRHKEGGPAEELARAYIDGRITLESLLMLRVP